MTKPILDERFADWVDGRLKPGERALLEAELVRDPALAQAAEDYRRTVQILRGALAPSTLEDSVLEDSIAEDSIADRVLQSLEPAAPARPRLTIRPLFASVIAAAALVLAFVVVRAIPPGPQVDVTETAKRDTVSGSDDFFAGGRRPAAPASESGQLAEPAPELQRVQEPTQAPQAVQAPEARPLAQSDAAELAARLLERIPGAAGAEDVGAMAKRVRVDAATRLPDTPTPSPTGKPAATADEKSAGEVVVGAVTAEEARSGEELSADKRAAAPAGPVAGPFAEQVARWTEGLGELALVVEPGVSDARAGEPLALLGAVAGADLFFLGGAEAKDRPAAAPNDPTARRRLDLGVREISTAQLGVAYRDRIAADVDDESQRREQATVGRDAEATDRVFVISGTAAAMREFAHGLQVEVAARDGRVQVERSQQLAELVAANKLAEAELGRKRGARIGFAATSGPATPGPATVGPAGGVAAGGARAAGRGAPEPHIELHVIVRARALQRGK